MKCYGIVVRFSALLGFCQESFMKLHNALWHLFAER